MQNVSRRKYAKVVKFLTATMTDDKMAHRTRFAAASRLADLLTLADARAEKLADRKYRAEQRALNPQTPIEPEPEETQGDSEGDRITKIIDSVMSKDKPNA